MADKLTPSGRAICQIRFHHACAATADADCRQDMVGVAGAMLPVSFRYAGIDFILETEVG